jgi:ubiquinone/menaquinone biosynthesis C-methylase UbiE
LLLIARLKHLAPFILLQPHRAMDYDRTQIPTAYDRGRDHGPEVLALWMNAIATHVQGERIKRILDLGCGTGRFTEGLAANFDAEVFGVDPSTKMLEQAMAKRRDRRVTYQLGSAEGIPLKTDTIDLVFMSMSFHHFRDPLLAGRECRRVLRPGGRVFVRTATNEQIPNYPYVPFIPATRPLLEAYIPRRANISAAFEAAGLRTISREIINQTIAPSWSVYADKLSTGSDSILARLSPAQFEEGRPYAVTVQSSMMSRLSSRSICWCFDE